MNCRENIKDVLGAKQMYEQVDPIILIIRAIKSFRKHANKKYK